MTILLTMNKSSRLPPPPLSPHLRSTIPAVPIAAGSALDVIVVVPSWYQFASFSRSCSSRDDDDDDGNGFGNTDPGNRGVITSSDFFVTFPSGLTWITNNDTHPNVPRSIRKSISKPSSSKSVRSYLYRKSKSFLSDIRSNSLDHHFYGSKIKVYKVTNNNQTVERDEANEDGEEGIEVGDGSCKALETTSERGTLCTEARHSDEILEDSSYGLFQSQQYVQTANVQVQINGRYIPELDMIFAPKRGNAMTSSFLFGSTTSVVGGGRDESETTSCQFVNGNGLRPSIETLDMLLTKRNDEHTSMEQSCTCHADIKTSEFHLCSVAKQDKPKIQQKNGILTPGRNLIRYSLFSQHGLIIATAEAHLYLWKSSDSIVVSDIDGTITKSDIRGVFDTIIQDKFEHIHDDICVLFQSILDYGKVIRKEDCTAESKEDSFSGESSVRRQQPTSLRHNSFNQNSMIGDVRFLYLSARPISLIGQTRKLLQSVSQTCPLKKIHKLPPGPIFCHRSALSSVLYSEIIAKNIHEFKADVLVRQVVLSFAAARGDPDCKFSSASRKNSETVEEPTMCSDENTPQNTSYTLHNDDHPKRYSKRRSFSGRSSIRQSSSGLSDASSTWDDRLFLAGFGNKTTDAVAYEMAGINRGDIYIIDSYSNIFCMGVCGRREEFSGDPADMIASTNNDCCMDHSECSFVDVVCCSGGIDKQLFSETTSSAQSNHNTMNPLFSREASSSSLHFTINTLPDDCRHYESRNVDATIGEVSGQTPTISDIPERRSSVRAFTSKIPAKKFSLLKSTSSVANPSPHFVGYGDPLLLDRMRKRVAEKVP